MPVPCNVFGVCMDYMVHGPVVRGTVHGLTGSLWNGPWTVVTRHMHYRDYIHEYVHGLP